MNNARMWLVVNPTVGIPVFLGAVAVGSFAVHLTILSNTSWVANFLEGNGAVTAAIEAPVQTAEADAKVYFDAAVADTATVTLPDGRTGTVVFEDVTTVAAVIPDSD